MLSMQSSEKMLNLCISKIHLGPSLEVSFLQTQQGDPGVVLLFCLPDTAESDLTICSAANY